MREKELITYSTLIGEISETLERGREEAYSIIGNILLVTYWKIGRLIVKYEQKGDKKAEYGTNLLKKLSKDLKFKYGKGFSVSNIYLMRLFYLKYPKTNSRQPSRIFQTSGIFQVTQKHQTLSGKSAPKSKFISGINQTSGKFQVTKIFQTPSRILSWSHYVELLSISDDLARSFYEQECVKENWSVRTLKRQINSMLFERLALSKNKQEILRLAKQGHTIKEEKDILKEPYILEFLGMPEKQIYSEKELEQKIIDNLQMFLLELGKGFTFVKRQFRITLNNNNFYIDLVFYNRILRCFVLIDLKIGKVSHSDVGQMNMYLNYFKHEENTDSDNQPIGIILAADKDDIMVEYALGGISNKLFVSRYKLYLPDKQKLEDEVRKLISN